MEMKRQGVFISDVEVDRGLGFAGDKAAARVSVLVDPDDSGRAAQNIVLAMTILIGPEAINGVEVMVFSSGGEYQGSVFTDAPSVRRLFVERSLSAAEFRQVLLLDVEGGEYEEDDARDPFLLQLFPEAIVL